MIVDTSDRNDCRHLQTGMIPDSLDRAFAPSRRPKSVDTKPARAYHVSSER
jgi:hypothetical protein